jgi:hypothetical protein
MAVKKGRTAPKAGKAKGAADAGSLAPVMPKLGGALHITIEPISNGHLVTHSGVDDKGNYTQTKVFSKERPTILGMLKPAK